MAISIGHLAITVQDMDKALDFYVNGLGFRHVFDFDRPENGEPWIVYVHLGNGQFIELFYGGDHAYHWDEHDRAYNHVCFTVDDMDAVIERLDKAGYSLDELPKIGCDGNRQCWITDPDGVRIEIMQLAPDSPQSRVIRGEYE